MSLVHIHSPQTDDFGIWRHNCPTCERRTYQVWRHTPWYGSDVTCMRCGEAWQDGVRSERPFAPRWRERRKSEARALYRRLLRHMAEAAALCRDQRPHSCQDRRWHDGARGHRCRAGRRHSRQAGE